jgi:hypothetical protein
MKTETKIVLQTNILIRNQVEIAAEIQNQIKRQDLNCSRLSQCYNNQPSYFSNNNHRTISNLNLYKIYKKNLKTSP